MTKEEIAKCKVGDEVEYLAISVSNEFLVFRGRVGIIQDIGCHSASIKIPGARSYLGDTWTTAWKNLRYIGKKQRQLTFVFTE